MFILDTNILSDLIRKNANAGLLKKLREIPAESIYTTSINVMELRFGAAGRDDERKFWDRIKSEILSKVSILGFYEKEAVICGDILADLNRRGEKIGIEDSMIAAIAASHGFTVVTANTRHLSRVKSIRVENWLITPAP